MRFLSFAGDAVYIEVWDRAERRAHTLQVLPTELAGMSWRVEDCPATSERCEAVNYRIAEVARDIARNTMPLHGDNSDVWLYRVEFSLASAPEQWRGMCEGDAADGMGLFVDGQWSEDGAWHPEGWTFSCASGVVAKCVRGFGYKPWKTLESPAHGPVNLQPLHQACTRAARADYCGDGHSHTRDGTLVDMFDTYGFNVRETVAGMAPESSFDEQGALSVSIPRWPTAARTAEGWRFPTCERTRQAPVSAGPALIYVWSDPSKGRGDASAQ